MRRPAVLLTAIDATLQSDIKPDDEAATIPPAAYLVALLSTLSQLASTPAAAKAGDKRELLEATLYLLSLLTPHLDQPLLRTKLPVLATLAPLYPSFATHAPALKSLIAISQSILSALSQVQLEKDLPARTVFAHVLSLAGDARPKVRRRAQEAVGALLASPPPPATAHPYGTETAGWILDRLEDAVKGAKRGGKKEQAAPAKQSKGAAAAAAAAAAVGGEEAGGSDESRAIALLTFIKNLGTAWSDEVRWHCSAVHFPSLTHVSFAEHPRSPTYPSLDPHTFFASSHPRRSHSPLSPLFGCPLRRLALGQLGARNARRPHRIQAQGWRWRRKREAHGGLGRRCWRGHGGVRKVSNPLLRRARVVRRLTLIFSTRRTNPSGALAHASVIFPSILPTLASATLPPLRQAVETALELMIRHCFPDSEVNAAVALQPSFDPSAAPQKKDKKKQTDSVTDDAPGQTLLDLIDLVDKSLTSPRYAANALPHVLSLSKALFFRLRLRPTLPDNTTRPTPAAATLLSKTLVLIGKMREDERFEWKREAEGVLDAAIKVCGPEAVLSIMPLGLEEGANPGRARAWLLPLLKPSITNTRLGHFRESFVPLSSHFFSKAEAARGRENGMEAKVWETLVGQVWALLPGYCEYPTDLIAAFDTEFVSLIANVVYTQPSLRPAVFKALSVLITTTTSLASSSSPPDLLFAQFGLTPADGQASLAHLRSLAATILGMSFNVYGKLSRGEGAYILTTVGEWLAVLPAEELTSTYERVEGLLVAALAIPVPSTKGHGAPKNEDDAIPPTHALLDILISLIPHAGPVERRFFDLASGESVLGSADQAVQKKGYRILARLAEERNGKVIEGRVGEVLEKLVDNAGVVAHGAKRVSESSLPFRNYRS